MIQLSKFVSRIWIKVNDLSGAQNSANMNKRFKNPMLRLDLCDYSDAFIAVKGRIGVIGTNNTNRRNKKLTLTNNASFRSCI